MIGYKQWCKVQMRLVGRSPKSAPPFLIRSFTREHKLNKEPEAIEYNSTMFMLTGWFFFFFFLFQHSSTVTAESANTVVGYRFQTVREHTFPPLESFFIHAKQSINSVAQQC